MGDVDEEKINDLGFRFSKMALENGVKIKKGKKIYHKVILAK